MRCTNCNTKLEGENYVVGQTYRTVFTIWRVRIQWEKARSYYCDEECIREYGETSFE